MSKRSIVRRLEDLEGSLGKGGRRVKVEYYKRGRDGTLTRLPRPSDGGNGGADRTMRVVFGPDPDGGDGPGPS